MIVSVPHTGTRTLMRVLGETDCKHFCQNEADFEGLDVHFDFPIRDPLATSLSWRSYQTNREDMDEFRRWEAAIAFLPTRRHTIHVIEQYPVLEGQSSKESWWQKAYTDRDIDALKRLPEVEYLIGWIARPEVAAFFRPHYGGFWWQGTASRHS